MGYSRKSKQILDSSKLVALNIIQSVATLAYICATYTRRASQKLVRKTLKQRSGSRRILGRRSGEERDFGEESFGDGGVWRRSILMGDKCEPLDFSGVIYYDSNGKMLSGPPMKSPRASPLVAYGGYKTSENY